MTNEGIPDAGTEGAETAPRVGVGLKPAPTAPEKEVVHVIDVFVLSIKCGNCDTYQTLVDWKRGPERNVWTYECENETCDVNVTRTLIEVPLHLDHSEKRWHDMHYPARPGA